MNLEKAKVLLEKISALMKSMEMSPDQVASIELDLMKTYLRDLYEQFQSPEQVSVPRPFQKEIQKQTEEPLKTAAKKTEIVFDLDDATKPETVQKEVIRPVPPVEQKPEPPAPIEVIKPEPEIEKIPEVKVEEIKTEERQPEKVEIEKEVKTTVSYTYKDPELEEIFEIKSAKELSEKLSQLPIPDLTKAFGLNEKIFTINELFGGNAELFTRVVQRLNSMDNFSEAKTYLIDEVAVKEEWSAPDKKKKAIEFIKLVKRRYN
jgi:hypothetical protein